MSTKKEFECTVIDFASARMHRDLAAGYKDGPNVRSIVVNPLVRLPKGDYFKVTNDGKSAEVFNADMEKIQSYPELDPVTYGMAMANALLERKILHLRMKYESDSIDWANAPSYGVSLAIPRPDFAMMSAMKDLVEILNQKLLLEKRQVQVKITQYQQEIILMSNLSPVMLSFSPTDSIDGYDLVCTAMQCKYALDETQITARIDFKNAFRNNEERLHFLRVLFKQNNTMDVIRMINRARAAVEVTGSFALAHNQK